MNPEWWVWIVGGIALVLAELIIPSFFIVWFGLAALLIGLLSYAFSLSLTGQLATWILASLAMVFLWFRLFNTNSLRTRAGTADGDAIGEIGLLVSTVAPFERGKVRFQRPVLGADEWICLADTPITAGDRVKVVAIEGSFLKVSKI